jgi:lipopolysaccharide transport system permease protein
MHIMPLSAGKTGPDASSTSSSSTPDENEPPLTVIGPRAESNPLDLAALWRYRELLYFLAWRDVKVRYKQTLLGAAWAVLQPTLMMVIFTLVLHRMAGVSGGDVPYPLFVYAGLLPWVFFASAITAAGQSVVSSEQLITKVHFPRLLIPFGAVAAAMVDFALAFTVLLCLMAYYGVAPAWTVVFLPGAVLLLVLAALGVGALLAALNVAYRDVRHVLPFLVQLWLFATPSIYLPTTTPPAGSQANDQASAEAGDSTGADSKIESAPPPGVGRWFDINPLNGLIAFFRSALVGDPLPWGRVGYSALLIGCLFAAGCYYFRRVEDSFADVI